jgi:hypothetical protein
MAAHKKTYFAERAKIDSDLAARSIFRSSVAWKLTDELAINNLNAAVDECFKFTLTYASNEGASHHELIGYVTPLLANYRDELAADLDKRITQIGNNSIQGHADESKARLSAVISDKEKLALKGWVNSEKVYSGSLISPSLRFFNLICRSYDELLEKKAPHLKKRLEAAYESMESDNPSHWANAVHECRKIFEDLADLVFPAQDTLLNRGGKEVKVGKEQFVNRIASYVESKSDSKSYERVVGAHLDDFGEKLDALTKTTQKGSHAAITKEHAALYIGEIYLLVGGVLSL